MHIGHIGDSLFSKLTVTSESPKCVKTVTSCQIKITCNECKKIVHGQCVQMSKDDIDIVVSHELVWWCQPCSNDRWKSMAAETGQTSLSDIIFILQSIKEEHKRMEKDLQAFSELCHSKIYYNSSVLKEQSTKIEAYLNKIEELMVENVCLKKHIKELESHLDECECSHALTL